jgi:hypothetical protein
LKATDYDGVSIRSAQSVSSKFISQAPWPRKQFDVIERESLGWSLHRISDEQAANIESAIVCAKIALRDLDGSGLVVNWIVAKKQLGLGYSRRIRGYSDRNIEDAIACFTEALSFSPEGLPNLSDIRNALGSAFLLRQVVSCA